jgi:protein-S-isoprenylcysteine O-methyltransferase Ste14
MAVAAIVLYAVWFLLAFGLRTILQLRRTGDSGWRAGGLPGHAGSTEWWAGLLFVVALTIGLSAPIADLVGLEPVEHAGWIRGAGVALACLGILLTFIAQVSMGDSWRIGVDESERTDLVIGGAFEIVRNPIFSAMFVTACGLALMVPNVIAIAGVVALVVALELQVRGVEEPYLLSVHGSRYASYAAAIGRFAPRLGRIPPHEADRLVS